MKSLISLSLTIFLIQIIAFLPIFHCRVSLPKDANLIDHTCKKTPHYDLCVSSLKSDSRSFGADVKGLGLIMVDVVKAKATDTRKHINWLLKHKHNPRDITFGLCCEAYNGIIDGDIPETNEALSKGDFKFAVQSMNGVSEEAKICEDVTRGPLTDKNKAVQDVAAVAAAIAKAVL